MGGAFSTYGDVESCIKGFWLGNLMERDNLKVPSRRWEDNIKVYVRVGMNQIDLTQFTDRWPAPERTVINYCVPYYAGKFFTS
jgi:hypothetical protein